MDLYCLSIFAKAKLTINSLRIIFRPY